ncbi:MAG: hypothetical protein OEV66_10800 [Spirochaetia bacterium]|nr:hypothetical protein [Spirochaetia bacterium]
MKMDFARPAPELQKYISGYYFFEGKSEQIAQLASTWIRPFIIINHGDDSIVSIEEKLIYFLPQYVSLNRVLANGNSLCTFLFFGLVLSQRADSGYIFH